jgi:hypothetical protein
MVAERIIPETKCKTYIDSAVIVILMILNFKLALSYKIAKAPLSTALHANNDIHSHNKFF